MMTNQDNHHHHRDPMSSRAAAGAAAAISPETRVSMNRYEVLYRETIARKRCRTIALLKEDAQVYREEVSFEERFHDKDIILAAIGSKNPLPFVQYMDTDNDDDDVPPFIPLTSPWRQDSDIWMELTKLKDFQISPSNVDWIPQGLLSNKPMVMAMCQATSSSSSSVVLSVASDELQNDPELVTKVFLKDPLCLQYASEQLRNDQDFFLTLLQQYKDQYNTPPASDGDGDGAETATTTTTASDSHDIIYRVFCDVIPEDSAFRNNRAVALALLSCGGKPSPEYRDVLLEFSNDIRKDRQVMELAVSLDGFLLEDASSELRNDRDLVLLACQNDGRAIQFASTVLHSDEELVRVACENHGEAFFFIKDYTLCETLCKDVDFMRQIICNHGGVQICIAPPELKSDESLLLEAIRNGMDFNCINLVLENDNNNVNNNKINMQDFILKALSINPLIYDTLRRKQRRNPEIVKAAILGGYLLTTLSETGNPNPIYADFIGTQFPHVLQDPQVFLWMAENLHHHHHPHNNNNSHGYYQRSNIPLSMRGDKEFMKQACSLDGLLLRYAEEEIRHDPDVYKVAIANNHEAIEILSDPYLCLHTDVVLEYLAQVKKQHGQEPVKLSSTVLASDRRIVLAYAKLTGCLDDDDLEDYRDDADVVRAVVTRDPDEMQNASNRLLNDKEFLLPILRQSGKAFLWLPSSTTQSDFDLRVAAIGSYYRVVEDLEDEYNEEAVWKFAKLVREKLSAHDNFTKEILCAIDIGHPDDSHNDNDEVDDYDEDSLPSLSASASASSSTSCNHPLVPVSKYTTTATTTATTTTTTTTTTSDQSLTFLTRLIAEAPLMSMFFGGFGEMQRMACRHHPTTYTILHPAVLALPPSPPPPPCRRCPAPTKATKPQCALSLLRLGGETGITLKRSIADYLGMPRGQELMDLKKCSENLTKYGY